MLKAILVHNYRCLRHIEVDLCPLTVLIGKNDSGKSSFLEAITRLSESVGHVPRGLPQLHGQDNEYLSINRTINVGSITASFTNDASRVEVKFGAESATNKGPWVRVANIPAPFRLDTNRLRQPCQIGGPSPTVVMPNGDGLVRALDALSHDQFGRVQAELVSRINTIEGILLPPFSAEVGKKRLAFKLRGGGVIDAKLASDGVLLVLAFLVIANGEQPPPLVMIEEPENGIHPKQLEYVIQLLHSFAERKGGTQVIVTTHSPYLLDFVDRDSVRVFVRTEDGGTVISPLSSLQPITDMLSRGYTLGEAWYNCKEGDVFRGLAK